MAPTARSWSALTLVHMLRKLSRAQYAVATAFGFVIAATFGFSGAYFLLVVLALPVFAFFARVVQLQPQYEISDREVAQLLVTLGGGMFPGAAVAVAWELVLALLFAVLCFFDQRDAIRVQLDDFLDADAGTGAGAVTMASSSAAAPPHAGRIANVLQTLHVERTFGFYVFVLLSAFVIAGLVEEATKLWVVQGRCLCNCSKTSRRGWLCDPRRLLLRRVDHANHHVVIVLAVTAAAAGFSTLENAAFTFASPTFSDRLQVAVLRSAMSLPLHAVCGAITGIRLARALLLTPPAAEAPLPAWRQKSWVLYPSVLVHGSFDLQIFLVSSFVSSAAASAHPFLYDVLIPGVLTVGVLVGAFKLGQQQWRELEAETNGRGQYAYLGRDQEERGDRADDSDDDDEEAATAKPHHRSGVLLV